MPGSRGWRDRATRAFVETEHVALELAPIGWESSTGTELLSHHYGQLLEGRSGLMKLLKTGIGLGIAERIDKELRVQDPLLRRSLHSVGSAGAISRPSMARVPRTSSR